MENVGNTPVKFESVDFGKRIKSMLREECSNPDSFTF